MITHSAECQKSKAAARGPRRVIGVPAVLGSVLILLAAAGVPMSQLLRVAEVTPAAIDGAETAQRQYQIVLAAAFSEAVPAAAQKSAGETVEPSGPKEPQKSDDTPRVMKLVAEHWEAASRVQLGESSVAPVAFILDSAPAAAPPVVVVSVLHSTFDPPNPPARGPPVQF